MITYIKTLVQGSLKKGAAAGEIFVVLKELAVELDRFDPRDFSPDVQAGFVLARGNIRKLHNKGSFNGTEAADALRALLPLLDGYLGEDARGAVHPLGFVRDPDLRTIIQRDYAELKQKLYPSQAWKSTVVLAGSILEAVLFDLLSNPKNEASALAATRAPKKGGNVKPLDEWHLIDLISVAEELNLLPPDRARSIDQVLRDYRNFVHPKKEIKSAHPCDENEAMMAVGALGAVCDHLQATFTP